MERQCVYYLALQDSQSFMFAFKMSMCHFQFWPQKLHFLPGRTTYDMTCCTNTNACEKIIYPSIHQFVSFSTPLEDQNLWELNCYCEPLHSHVSSLSGLVYCFSCGSCFSPVILHFPSFVKTFVYLYPGFLVVPCFSVIRMISSIAYVHSHLNTHSILSRLRVRVHKYTC